MSKTNSTDPYSYGTDNQDIFHNEQVPVGGVHMTQEKKDNSQQGQDQSNQDDQNKDNLQGVQANIPNVYPVNANAIDRLTVLITSIVQDNVLNRLLQEKAIQTQIETNKAKIKILKDQIEAQKEANNAQNEANNAQKEANNAQKEANNAQIQAQKEANQVFKYFSIMIGVTCLGFMSYQIYKNK